MKKIIRNKVYDTETAAVLASSEHCTLFRKRTGEFFLFITAIRPEEIAPIESAKLPIQPLTYHQAQAWGKKHMDAADWGRVFGIGADQDDVQISCVITAAQNAKLRRIASERGVSVTEIIREMIDTFTGEYLIDG